MNKKKIVILFAESEFTPWKENIDFNTVQNIYNALIPEYYVVVCHMVEPCLELGEFLSEFEVVINLCYGFKGYSQSDIAGWLDESGVNHISSNYKVQNLAQDKASVEEILLECGINTPVSESEISEEDAESLYILKPRFGGCHRDIQIDLGQNLALIKEVDVHNDYCLQKFLLGREFSVGVIVNSDGDGFEALPPIEVLPTEGQGIFIAGNSFGATRKVFVQDEDLISKLKELAIVVHWTVGLEYYSRIDFRMHNDIIYVLDVNAMPNMHPTKSVFPAMLENEGISLLEFYSRCIKRNMEIREVDFKLQQEEEPTTLLN